MNIPMCCVCGEPAAFPTVVKEPYTCLTCQRSEQPESAATEKPKAVSSSELVLPHRPIAKLLWMLDALGEDETSLRVHGMVDKTARLREVRILTRELGIAVRQNAELKNAGPRTPDVRES